MITGKPLAIAFLIETRMNMTTGRLSQPLPPVSRAHQEGLRSLISSLEATGQDVRLLTQLAESLPRLRAGLSAPDRQRIEALDASETALATALNGMNEALTQFDDVQGPSESPTPLATILVEPAILQQIAMVASTIAEAANDLALRARERADLLV
jgi:hypothetical protein